MKANMYVASLVKLLSLSKDAQARMKDLTNEKASKETSRLASPPPVSAARFQARQSVLVFASHRSNANMYAQVIDDVTGKTICALSTLGPDFKKTERRAQRSKVPQSSAIIALLYSWSCTSVYCPTD